MLLYSDTKPAEIPSHCLPWSVSSTLLGPGFLSQHNNQPVCAERMDPRGSGCSVEARCVFSGEAVELWTYSTAFHALTLPLCASLYSAQVPPVLLRAWIMHPGSSAYTWTSQGRNKWDKWRVLLREWEVVLWTTANSVSFSMCQSLWCYNPSAPEPSSSSVSVFHSGLY